MITFSECVEHRGGESPWPAPLIVLPSAAAADSIPVGAGRSRSR